jgi:hypothetical protein
MSDAKTNKCAHPLCSCAAREGSKYCSSNCEAAKDSTEIACECGHSGCTGVVAAA